MSTRTSSARWQGNLKEGSGTMEFGSGAFEGPYTYVSRWESGPGTNPEELIAAAHAGCFSMAFSNKLAQAGHTPTSVETKASVTIEGPTITRSHLVTQADVPGIDEAEFQKIAEDAKATCPVSKALGAIEITLDATLV
jgi:osmotically inducible protein OsmC